MEIKVIGENVQWGGQFLFFLTNINVHEKKFQSVQNIVFISNKTERSGIVLSKLLDYRFEEFPFKRKMTTNMRLTFDTWIGWFNLTVSITFIRVSIHIKCLILKDSCLLELGQSSLGQSSLRTKQPLAQASKGGGG